MPDYTKMTRQQLVPILAEYLTDYGNFGADNAINHVQSWLNQFERGDQNTILQEMCLVFSRFYFKREEYKRCADGFVQATNVFGDDVGSMLEKTRFIKTLKGNGQRDVFAFVDEEMQKRFSLDHSICGRGNPERFLYLDDTIFTGKNAFTDIERGLQYARRGSHLTAIFFIAYSSGMYSLEDQLNDLCTRRGITYDIRAFNTIEDTGEKLNRMMPTEVCGRGVNCDYIRNLLPHNGTVEMFRDSDAPKEETLFSSSQARLIVERAFLDKGSDLLNYARNPRPDMFPLGFGNEGTLGFGAMICTYRNIPNNAPLVLWWGRPEEPLMRNNKPHPISRWNPLLRRKTRS